MARVNWKGSVLLSPVPSVMVSCGTMEESNIVTVGWTGVISTHPPRVYISLRPERHSHGIISKTGEFVINLVPADLAEICDYVGTVTGRCVNKAEKTGLTMTESVTVGAPSIAECPLSLECKVRDVQKNGSHDMFIADVTQVTVDESLIDGDGHLRLDLTELLCFSHGEYFRMGKKIGKIGMSVADKKKGKYATMEEVSRRKARSAASPHRQIKRRKK